MIRFHCGGIWSIGFDVDGFIRSVDNISVEIGRYGTYVLFRIRRMNRRKNKTFIITERYNYYGTITKTVSSSRHATVLYIAFYHNVCHSNYCL